MVSNRCKLAVKEELKKLHLHFIVVALGEVEIMEDITSEQREQFKNGLLASGLELIDDSKAVLIEKIKAVIIQMVHHSEELIKTNFSDFISKKLDYDYTYLANLFSEVQGTTIEQFIISHKIERIKELIIYDELNISEIAWKLNYSSVSHLSNQFKKITGLSPSHFKQLKDKRRSPIEEIGNVNNIHQKKTTIPEVYLTPLSEAIDVEEHKYTRSLIEASLDPFVTISAEGKITDVNLALVNVTGIPREQLINSDFTNYFTEPKKAKEGYLQVFDKGFVENYELTIKHKNGKLTDVSYNASVYKDNNGQVLGVFAAARDVSHQKWVVELRSANKELAFQNEEKEKRSAELAIANKKLAFQNHEKGKQTEELRMAYEELIFQNEESEKRAAELEITDQELIFQTQEKDKEKIANIKLETLSDSLKLAYQYSLSLIEASHDPLIAINNEGKITDMNEAMVNVTGQSRKELTGTDFFEYFTEPQKARDVYQEIFAKGSVADYPLTLRHKNEKLTGVLFNGSVYKNDAGKVQGVVVVARDVTEQNRIAAELTEAIVFAEMATTFAEEAKYKAEKATHIAEDAVKAKQLFLSNMSHEIRTPMNAIIGFTKVLLKTELSAKQQEYLNAIKLSGDSLIVLINDILDLAKVDAGKMTFEQVPFKMSVSIAAMTHLFEPKIQEKNLKLIKEYDKRIPDVLVGDPVRLNQIILNLMSNAVKFTSKGKITVGVRMLTKDENSMDIEFYVTDTGIGIKKNKIDHIFENFQQASSHTSSLYGGTGLGLAIVKQLVEAQNGTVQVVSTVNEGSTFSFILNFSKTNAIAEHETESFNLDTELSDVKVLVVEDIMLNQLLMRTLLDDYGFECDIADNGKIAIDKMQLNTYDVVLMDLQMPEMNGFEATDYIRNTLNSHIPIIALTADVTTVDLAKCKAVGMNDYIAKPVDEKLLYNKMVELVKMPLNGTKPKEIDFNDSTETKCTNLKYLNVRTKSNPVLMMEMISLYLKQTPPLVMAMKKGLQDKDWDSVYTAVHKLIPSFSIMGISTDFENMAKKVQEFASNQQQLSGIPEMVNKLENVCVQACEELENEFIQLKTKNND
jgi:PAS domain S-box-containing protein